MSTKTQPSKRQSHKEGTKRTNRNAKAKPVGKPLSAFEVQKKDFEQTKEVYLSYFRTFGFQV